MITILLTKVILIKERTNFTKSKRNKDKLNNKNSMDSNKDENVDHFEITTNKFGKLTSNFRRQCENGY